MRPHSTGLALMTRDAVVLAPTFLAPAVPVAIVPAHSVSLSLLLFWRCRPPVAWRNLAFACFPANLRAHASALANSPQLPSQLNSTPLLPIKNYSDSCMRRDAARAGLALVTGFWTGAALFTRNDNSRPPRPIIAELSSATCPVFASPAPHSATANDPTRLPAPPPAPPPKPSPALAGRSASAGC